MKKTNEMSKLAGVSKRTLQYYDDEGLLITERTNDNHRLYDREAMERIWEILVYKEMGLELREIKKVFSLSETEKAEYFKNQIIEQKKNIRTIEGKIKFISLILEQGFPEMPDENSGITYICKIAELREECIKGHILRIRDKQQKK